MMGYARLDPIFRAAGFCLVGALVPAQSVAAEQGWLPVVVKTGNTGSPRSESMAPPSPRAKRTLFDRPEPPASSKGGVFTPDTGVTRAAAPAAVTGKPAPDIVGTIESIRTLSAADTARLKEAKAGELPRPEESGAAATIPDTDLARRYCVNLADAAADARIAWQKAKLAEAEQQIDKRIAALEAKTAEYRIWLERREEFSRKVTKKLVEIYAKMEPEAAAMQLVSMDEEAAASILAKLDPRNSSTILNEMQPAKAARLAATLVGAARMAQKKSAAPNAGGPAPDGAPRPNADGGGL